MIIPLKIPTVEIFTDDELVAFCVAPWPVRFFTKLNHFSNPATIHNISYPTTMHYIVPLIQQ